MTLNETNRALADRWRCALQHEVEPCPRCGRLVFFTFTGSPWDLSAHDARIVAALRGIDRFDPLLGEGISGPHPCGVRRVGGRVGSGVNKSQGRTPRSNSTPDDFDSDFDSEAGGASRWESRVNLWVVRLAKRAKEQRGENPVLHWWELDQVLPPLDTAWTRRRLRAMAGAGQGGGT